MANYQQRFESLEEPQKRGQATEARVKSEFVVRDIPVLVPEYDNESYDFVIEIDGRFYKLQAKTAYQHTAETVRFETVSTRTRSDGYDRTGYDETIDHFVVYNPVLDEVYLIPVEDAATGKMEIRFVEPANNQRVGINWHEEFRLSDQLEKLYQDR